MRQSAFQAAHAERWDAFAEWLAIDDGRRQRRGTAAGYPFPPEDFPARYREVCQHLALARDRRYGPDLVERLNGLALAGHAALYGARGDARARVAEFLLREFPRLVRAEWRCMLVASLAFFGPLVALTIGLQLVPDAVHYFLDPQQMASMQSMYSKSAERIGAREASSDVMMFAYYIWNNVRIGFQTFAGGLAFGAGSLFFLVYNGLNIGAVAGFLVNVGLGETFWSFVAGHSALELIAIALSGGAGLRLAMALVRPGNRTRRQALVEAAQPAVRIMIGAAIMFVAAAFVEGFWSPHRYLPPVGKYAVGIALWILVPAWLLLAGRRRGA